MLSLISGMLREREKPEPVLIGGCALAYYSREVYFTADIDLAYPDRQALDQVLQELGFVTEGRYWVQPELKIAVEVPVESLPGEDAPLEVVEMGENLECRIIGLEDLLIDKMNACKYWKSSIDCEMVELLLLRYSRDINLEYLTMKAALPENDTVREFTAILERVT
jgi:hypothetical protein